MLEINFAVYGLTEKMITSIRAHAVSNCSLFLTSTFFITGVKITTNVSYPYKEISVITRL
jgi:hypothetical protein